MIRFRFTINKSFLTGSRHPITVPRSQVDYDEMLAQGIAEGPLSILLPNGRRYSGELYYGVSAGGPYFQIKADGQRHDSFDIFEMNGRIFVEIERSASGLEVRLLKYDRIPWKS